MDIERMTMQLIMHGGMARSKSMEAIAAVKGGSATAAEDLLSEAAQELALAHEAQAELIQSEADGQPVPLSLLLVHAQDHLMNAITIRDMAIELVELYGHLKEKENKHE